MKIKVNKKHRLIIEYDLEIVKFSYCSDVFAAEPLYKSANLAKNNICLNDLNILVKELNVNVADSDVFVFLSRTLFMNRYLTLPTVDKEEIQKMLIYQLPKFIPYSMDEIIYDYKVISQVNNQTRVLVLLLEKQKLNLLNDFLFKNKSIAQYTGLTSELFINAYNLNDNSDEAKCVLYKHQGRAELIYYDHFIKYMRSFKYDDQKSLEKNIDHSLDLLEKELAMPELADLIVVDQINDLYSRVDAYDFAYDFSSLATQRLQRKRMMRNYAMNIAAVILQLFIICFLFVYKSNLINTRKIALLKSEVKQIKSELGDSSVVLDKLATLEALQQKRGLFSALLYNLVSLLPDRTVISTLNIDENNKFTVKGFASNMETIFKYVTQLNNKPAFEQVSAQNVSKVKQTNLNRVEFSIDGKWLEPAGVEND